MEQASDVVELVLPPEVDNPNNVYLYLEGDAWCAYERSAYYLSLIHIYKIDNLSYGTLDNLPKMVMSASADDVSVSGGKGFAILSLKRIYAMISVSVNTSGLKDRTIKPLKVSLHQVPATGKLLSLIHISSLLPLRLWMGYRQKVQRKRAVMLC